MAAPASTEGLLDLIRKSGLVSLDDLDAFLQKHSLPPDPKPAAGMLVRHGIITQFQARLLLSGKHRGFLMGNLKILDQLGVGGMGAVFLCEQTGLRRKVAVKVLPQKHAKDPVTRERFYREGRAAAALDHPNIVRVFDINTYQDVHYLVMEYIEGSDLQQIMNQEGPLPYQTAINYVHQAAIGLAHAHDRGLVHRDIKPSNLLVDPQGHVKILDMGLARFFQDSRDDITERYEQGAVLGTVDFLAPEQALQSSTADIRADIYSLGATLYTLIQGKPPFGGNTTEKLLHHQVKTPEPLTAIRTDVPKGVSDVVAKMMAKDPTERYQTPLEVVEALRPWMSESATIDNQKTTISPATRRPAVPSKPRRAWLPYAIVAGVMALVGIGLAIWQFTKEDKTPSPGVVQNPDDTGNPRDPVDPGKKDPVDPGKKDPKDTPKKVPADPSMVVELDLSEQPASRIRLKGTTVLTSEGKFVPGWKVAAWDREAVIEGETATIAGKPVVTLRNFEGKPSCMLFSPDFKHTANTLYEITIDYRTEGDGRGSMVVFDDVHKADRLGDIPNTKGAWTTAHFAFEVHEDVNGRIEIHSTGIGAENGLQLRKVEVRSRPLPRLTNPPIYRIDFSKEPLGSTAMKGRMVVSTTGSPLHSDWQLACWKADGTGTATVEKTGSTQALTLRNMVSPSMELISAVPFKPLKPGGRYLLRYTYLGEAKARAELQIRPLPGTSYTFGQPLGSTNGHWRTSTLYFQPETQSPFLINLSLQSSGAESAIHLRDLEVIELPTTCTVEKKYQVIFDAKNSFEMWMRKEEMVRKTGMGNWPRWWKGDGGTTEGLAEFAIETVDNRSALKIHHNEGTPTARIWTEQSVARLQAGKLYLIHLEYQSTNSGKLYLRSSPTTGEYASLSFPATAEKWIDLGILYQPRQDRALHLATVLPPNAKVPNATMWIRTITVEELRPKP